jgi:hypothetical protein
MPHSPFAIRYSLFAILDQGEAALRRGFTLIETALAMLAVGLGLLAFLGLGRLGLQSDKESLNDRRCAMLSNAVFETLRERNAYFVDLARTNQEGRVWYSPNQADLWLNAAQNGRIRFPDIAGITLRQDQPNIIFGTTTPAYDPDRISLANWNPRYQLDLIGHDGSSIAQNYNFLRFRLIIFPDGDTFSSEARVYTTTLTNPGGLP